jgi:hypothetical protein
MKTETPKREQTIRFIATDKARDLSSHYWFKIIPARRELRITKTQSCGKSITAAAMPNVELKHGEDK